MVRRVRVVRAEPGELLKPDPAEPTPGGRRPGGLRRAGRLRPVSPRKRARLAEQKRVSSGSIVCEMPEALRAVTFCTGRAVDDHHVRPQSLSSAHVLVRLCRPCHEWVEEHPSEARIVGLLDIREPFPRIEVDR